MNVIQKTLNGVDRFQQRHKRVAFPFGVVKKFGDDQAGNLAALIAYYGFFSLFPLMLVMVSVLGFVLRSNPSLRGKIINSALSQFPVIGTQLQHNIRGLTGTGAGVVLGLGTLGALWAGLGVMQAAQNAFNTVWDVPRTQRPNFIETRLRGLIMLIVLGAFTLVSTFLSGLSSVGGGKFIWLGALGLLGSSVLNLVIYMVAFRVLTDRDLSWGDVFWGALVGAVFWTALQYLGSYYVGHQVKNASQVYGVFGFVIALLGWIYLGAQITLYAAEVNVVRKNRLWPRSLVQPPMTEADKRTYARAAKAEERRPEEEIDVGFEPQADKPKAPDAVAADAPAPDHGQDTAVAKDAKETDGVASRDAVATSNDGERPSNDDDDVVSATASDVTVSTAPSPSGRTRTNGAGSRTRDTDDRSGAVKYGLAGAAAAAIGVLALRRKRGKPAV